MTLGSIFTTLFNTARNSNGLNGLYAGNMPGYAQPPPNNAAAAATISKFVRCIRVDTDAIPCYAQDLNRVWRPSHTGNEGTSKIRFVAMSRGDLQYFTSLNVLCKKSVVTLVPQGAADRTPIYVSRETALKYFYPDSSVSNQDDGSQQDSLQKIDINSPGDWTQYLPTIDLPFEPLPSTATMLQPIAAR
jgi:hypothetical protein